MIQLQTLNKILNTKDISIVTNNNLDSDFFPEYKQEFDFILNHFNTYGKVPDKETFIFKFPNFKLIDITEGNQYLLDELYKDKNTRDLALTFNKIKGCIEKGNVDGAMALFKSASERIISNKGIQPVNILSDTSRYDEYIEKTKDFNKFYIKTGLPELDKIIGG